MSIIDHLDKHIKGQFNEEATLTELFKIKKFVEFIKDKGVQELDDEHLEELIADFHINSDLVYQNIEDFKEMLRNAGVSYDDDEGSTGPIRAFVMFLQDKGVTEVNNENWNALLDEFGMLDSDVLDANWEFLMSLLDEVGITNNLK